MTRPRRAEDPELWRIPARAKRLERRTYTASEAAKILGIGRRGVYELVRAGRLGALRLGAEGHRILIPHAAIERLLGGDASNEFSNGSRDTELNTRLQKDTQHAEPEFKKPRRDPQK
jgi:excisionase family DNA binding protein